MITRITAVTLTFALIGCSSKPDETPVAADTASEATSAAPPASASAAAAVEKEPPTYELVPVDEKELEGHVDLYRGADGTPLIAHRPKQNYDNDVFEPVASRVGALRGDKIEWLGKIPLGGVAFGDKIIEWVGGTPEAIDVVYANANPRGPAPTYYALTGEGNGFSFSSGGGAGWVAGVAQFGESTVAAGYSNQDGYLLMSVRGPAAKLVRRTPTSEGCEASTGKTWNLGPDNRPAVSTYALASAPDGSLLSLGDHCKDGKPAVEIWKDDPSQSKLVRLEELEEVGFRARFLPGRKGQLWFATGDDDPIMEYAKGAFKALPRLETPRSLIFLSQQGDLLATDGFTIHRYDDGTWKLFAHLSWGSKVNEIVMHEGAIWASQGERLFKLEEAKPTAMSEGCKTPFVFLYDVSPKSEPSYTFPTTRKALSSMEGADAIQLVEFDNGVRRLGVIAPSQAVAERVEKHVRETMKDEHPRLMCFEPKSPRVLDLDGKHALER